MVERRLLPRETANFVPSVLAALIIFRNPERYGFEVEPEPQLAFESVPVDYQLDLTVAAQLINVPVTALQELNPELIRGVTPANRKYLLKVPVEGAELLKSKLAQLPVEKRVSTLRHRVRRGETLTRISRKYRVSVSALSHANGLRNANRLRVGQSLLIPTPGASGPDSVAASHEVASRPVSHVVRRGDSLHKIARTYGISVTDLLRWNGLKPGSLIYPGQRIRVIAEATESLQEQARKE